MSTNFGSAGIPGTRLKVCVWWWWVVGGGGGVRTKFSVQLWSQAEQLPKKYMTITILRPLFA